MKRLLVALAAAVALVSPTHAAEPYAQRDPLGQWDLDAYLATYATDMGAPALAAVVFDRDGVVAIGAAGRRSATGDSLVTRGDRFHIGSCTKAMTATMIATMVEDGELSWDTTIPEVFPEYAVGADPAWTGVTLEHLLTHTAGVTGSVMRDFPAVWGTFWSGTLTPREQRELLVKTVLSNPPAADPGTSYVYSNAGFSIAGAMAERVADTAYERLMHERLFEPLGIASAGFGAPGMDGALDQPLGHYADGRPQPVSGPSDNPPGIAPAGRVHLDIEDWATFVRHHLTGRRPGNELLADSTYARLQTPVEDRASYAMGWAVTAFRGEPLMVHSGSNTMWYATAAFLPDSGVGVVVACNWGGGRQVEGVVQELIVKLLDARGQ